MDWTSPADIKAQLQRHWDEGRMLSARLNGEQLFPLALHVRRPDGRALSQHFDEVRNWIRALEQESKELRGFGYEIEWTEVNHRQLGRNRLPARVVVPSEADALRLIGKGHQARSFQTLAETTLKSIPELREWLIRRPLAMLEHAEPWERVLSVLAWFVAHPRPGLYLRQLEIPGVDTKFIEARRGLLSQLLDRILPPDTVDWQATGVRGFEQRYGLKSKPPLIRFRLLDERLYLNGLSDLTVPVAQFARLSAPVTHVFITENEINGLAFPDMSESLVIFGMGYSLDLLANIEWLREKTLFYWGDIDTHGFAILNRLRAAFPHTHSLLMDRETLMSHRGLWVREGERHDQPLARLTAPEQALFDDLRHDHLGERVRLEQERIAFGRLRAALQALPAC